MTHQAIKSEVNEKRRIYMKRWRQENSEKVRAYAKQWASENAAERKEYMTAYNKAMWADPNIRQAEWERKLFVNYGISPKQFNEMWAEQDGKCRICASNLKPRGRGKKSAAVDHNHRTGEVRGILCCGCNKGLGHFSDDPELLQRAADYLAFHGHYAPIKD